MQTLKGYIKLLFKAGTKLQKTGEPAQDGSPFTHEAPSSRDPGPSLQVSLLSRVRGVGWLLGFQLGGASAPPPRPSGLASLAVSLSPLLPTPLH